MKFLFKTLCAFTLYFIAENLPAQDLTTANTLPETPATQATAPAVTAEEESKKLQVSGFVDAYYHYSFNENPFPTSFTGTHNSFTPGMANIVFAREGKFGFKADLGAGPRADAANGYAGTTLGLIKQLYITYSPVEAVKLTLGNFSTHVGYELIDAPGNVNYSTSYMFSYGPFFHTGLKADITLSDKFGFMVGIFDDTDTKIDVVSGKHIGSQLSYKDDKLAAYLNYVGGKVDDSNPEDELTAHQGDLTVTYAATDALGLGLNTTIKSVKGGETPESNWFGAALYAKYAFSDAFTLGLRSEYIGDKEGLMLGVTDNRITAFTLSGNINLGPVTLIPEFRVDHASENTYLDADDNPVKTNAALIFGAYYKF
jgi:hypothetical protein